MQTAMSADIAATEEDAAEAPILVTDDGEIIDLDNLAISEEAEAND